MKRSIRDIGIKDAYVYRHVPECTRVLADFYWRILLCVAFVVLALSLAFGIRELIAVMKGDDAGSGGPKVIQPIPKLNKTQLQNTLNAFREREAKFNSLQTGGQKVQVP